MKNSVILDASALLALIQNEKGADVVRPLLRHSIMSTINVAETLTVLQRAEILPAQAVLAISDIISTIIPFDLEQAQYVAELQPYVKHKGLSLGDRACLALGQKMQIPIYTADQIWNKLQLDNVEIKLIR